MRKALPDRTKGVLCGVCGAFGQLPVTAAYTFAPAREISGCDYTQVIFSAVMGCFLLGQTPDALSIVGYAVIIAMAVADFPYNDRTQ